MEYHDLELDIVAEDIPTRARKRGSKASTASRASKSDDDSKRNGKRGRPRVDSQDQNAVERRRTQIRLAQRAYRERKETTISGLEKRVSQLQKTVSEMNQAFMELHDSSIASGLDGWNPLLAERFRATSQQFTGLVFEVEMDAEVDDVMPKRKKQNRKFPVGSEAHVADFMEQEHASNLPASASPGPSVASMQAVSMMGYQVTYQDNLNSNVESIGNTNQEAREVPEWMENSTALQQYQTPDVPSQPLYTENWLGIDRPMKPVFTYNFQESSFARRLLRFAYEKTYHALTDPHTSPEKLHRILRYSLCFRSVKDIAARIKDRLQRTKNEPLEHWEVPVLHIGGAGLHYPRDGIDATVPPPQGFLAERNMGPFRSDKAQTHAPDKNFPFNIAEWAGIQGDYFDTYDVEQYLRTKGLMLDGTSSTAVIEVEDNSPVPHAFEVPLDSPDLSSVETLSGPHSPVSSNEQLNDFFSPAVDRLLFNDKSVASGTDISLNSAMDFDFPMFPDIEQQKVPSETAQVTIINPFNNMPTLALQPRKRKLTIDVDRLLETINEYGICLGRAPGYKKEDVDTALGRVLQEAW